jgi:hypothetical protein
MPEGRASKAVKHPPTLDFPDLDPRKEAPRPLPAAERRRRVREFWIGVVGTETIKVDVRVIAATNRISKRRSRRGVTARTCTTV